MLRFTLMALLCTVALSLHSTAQDVGSIWKNRSVSERLRASERIRTMKNDRVSGHVLGSHQNGALTARAVNVGSIEGTITGYTDIATAGLNVLALPVDGGTNGGLATYGTINEDGTYQIEELGAGDYYVVAQALGYVPEYFENTTEQANATPVSVVVGGITSDIDFHLDAVPPGTGSISGTVMRRGTTTPVADALVTASSEDNVLDFATAVVASDGTYELRGLNPGSYIIEVWAEGFGTQYYNDVMLREEATLIEIGDSSRITGINFGLDRGGVITGQVLDGAGNPVVDAFVEAYRNYDENDSISFNDIWRDFGMAYTDENGMYEISGLMSGDFIVYAGFSSDLFDYGEWYGNAQQPESSTPVAVIENQTTADIDFTLELPETDGFITGVITDQSGNPVPNAIVEVMLQPNDSMDLYYGMWMSARTDNNGRYRVNNLIDGEYLVLASARLGWDYAQSWWPGTQDEENATPVVIEDGSSTPSAVDIELPMQLGTASISGTVTGANGLPISGANAELLVRDSASSSLILLDYTSTDLSGSFAFRALPAGSYMIHVSHWGENSFDEKWYPGVQTADSATDLVLAAGETENNVNFTLDLLPSYGSIKGRVVDAATGAAVSRALVEVMPLTYDYNSSLSYGSWNYQMTTDANGFYTFPMLPKGEYLIGVYTKNSFEIYDDTQVMEEATTLTLEGDDTLTANFDVEARGTGGATISGRVTDDANGIIRLAVVSAVSEFSDEFYTTVTNSDGTYQLTGLPAGTYYVMSFAPDYISEFYRDSYDPWGATTVQVASTGSAANIDFTLSAIVVNDDPGGTGGVAHGPESGGMIYGIVTNAAGKPIRDAVVYLVGSRGEPISSARTGFDGRYELTGLTPGTSYRVMATGVGYEARYNGDARTFNDASALPLVEGRMNVDFTLNARTSSRVENRTERAIGSIAHESRPNPFSAQTEIRFVLPERMHVTVTVTDVLGREVARLHEGELQSGAHDFIWNARDAAGTSLENGLYFYRIQGGSVSQTGQMVLLR